MLYNPKEQWSKEILKTDISYPSEYVIRIFRGKYPKLDFTQHSFNQKKICDIGCGDGRNIAFLKKLSFDTYGVEITKDIADKVQENLLMNGVSAKIKVGSNESLPFENKYFDYLLSWNSSYYMGAERNFEKYVKEFARVLKPEGYLILSIPKPSCFIYQNSEKLTDEYQIIRNDPFKIRNGEVFRMFKNEKEIESTFSKYFYDFTFASIQDDCFGFNYHWFLTVCKRNNDIID